MKSQVQIRFRSSEKLSEDGARPVCRTGTQVPSWRLGALVFRPDLVRISHKVGRSAERRRIAVWAVGFAIDQLLAGRTPPQKDPLGASTSERNRTGRGLRNSTAQPSCRHQCLRVKSGEHRRGKGKTCLVPLSFLSNWQEIRKHARGSAAVLSSAVLTLIQKQNAL